MLEDAKRYGENRRGAEEGSFGMWLEVDLLFQAMANTITVQQGDAEDYGKLSCHLWPR